MLARARTMSKVRFVLWAATSLYLATAQPVFPSAQGNFGVKPQSTARDGIDEKDAVKLENLEIKAELILQQLEVSRLKAEIEVQKLHREFEELRSAALSKAQLDEGEWDIDLQTRKFVRKKEASNAPKK